MAFIKNLLGNNEADENSAASYSVPCNSGENTPEQEFSPSTVYRFRPGLNIIHPELLLYGQDDYFELPTIDNADKIMAALAQQITESGGRYKGYIPVQVSETARDEDNNWQPVVIPYIVIEV